MKTVVFCRAKEFAEEATSFAGQLREQGVTVFLPPLEVPGEQWGRLTEPAKRTRAMELTGEHLRQIAFADVVFIYNPDGRVDTTVTMEIGYAVAHRKAIYALNRDPELARDVFYQGVTATPDRLLQKLQDPETMVE